MKWIRVPLILALMTFSSLAIAQDSMEKRDKVRPIWRSSLRTSTTSGLRPQVSQEPCSGLCRL